MRLKLTYHDKPNLPKSCSYELLDLDTGQDLLKNNNIQSIVFATSSSLGKYHPILTIELVPEYLEIEINGQIKKVVKRAKLK